MELKGVNFGNKIQIKHAIKPVKTSQKHSSQN